ncbi:putative capsid [uncultured virus]|uniref:Putative capsid n=1 Tax=uncultured virus TaxID=340016 RepID=A0A2K9LSS2_9VIRU|nr:putative capsid [uncultured virus]
MALNVRDPRIRAGALAAAAGAVGNFYRHATPSERQRAFEMATSAGRAARRAANAAYNAAGFGRHRSSRPVSRVRGNAFPASYGGVTTRANRRRRFKRKKFRRKFGRKFRRRRGKSFLSKLWRTLCTPMVYKSTWAQAWTGVQGQRQFRFVPLAGETLMKTLGAKHPSNFLFNTAQGTSSTATLQDQGGTNWQMSLDKLVYDCRIQNRANASMELKIYECIIRRDVNSGGNFTVNDSSLLGMFNESTDIPTLIGQDFNNLGPGQAAFPTGVTHMYSHPGFNPFHSNSFVNFFKVQRIHSRVLQPNEVLPQKFFQKKKIFRGNHLLEASAYEWQRGWSKVLVFSWVGQPIDDNTTSHQTKAKCDLFFQTDVTAKYHFLPGDEHLVNFSWTNDMNNVGQQFDFNPASAITYVVPATEVVENVVNPADTVAQAAP